jgi:hypothetical protein
MANTSVSVPASTRPVPDFGNPAGHARVPLAGGAVGTNHPDHVIGTGTPASCTSAGVVGAVARGGVITFNCGPGPVTITMTATAKVVNTSHRIVLDGGGTVTLSGAGKRQILYMNACDRRQQWTTSDCYNQEWPELVVQNMTFEDGNSTVSQSKGASFGGGGGGAIFDLGGQLKVVNSRFIDNRCYHVGPDLGGAAVRALAQWRNKPVYITSDTFRGGQCSNGGALSSIGVSWVVLNSIMANNVAIGDGANPAAPGGLGGGTPHQLLSPISPAALLTPVVERPARNDLIWREVRGLLAVEEVHGVLDVVAQPFFVFRQTCVGGVAELIGKSPSATF